MALTNYLLQSVICGFIFYGHGWGLMGQVNRTQALIVVGGVWLFEVILSSIWLHYYTMGPVEWLWRGLSAKSFKPLWRRSGDAS
jgi:uncharacterized protein